MLILPFESFAATTQFYYGGWLPFWEKTGGASDLTDNLEKFHEISPFSYEVNPNGSLIDKLNITQGFWPPWIAALQDLHIKVTPSIAWFDGDAIDTLLSNKKTRIAQEDAITKLVVDRGFDGIDIDYESKLARTKPYFSLFIKGLAIRLHPKKKLLSCTVEPRTPLSSLLDNPPATVQRANDYAALNQYCDEVRIMAYDQGVADLRLNAQKGNGQLYAPVADTDWAAKVIQETLKTISRRKIVLGIPTYGYEYQVTWQPNGVAKYERLRSHSFFTAMDRADNLGMTPARNSAGELGFAYATTTYVADVSSGRVGYASSTVPAPEVAATMASGMTMRFVTFSDSESVAQKIKLAKQFGLRGVSFFKLDGQQDPYIWEVMK